ncbi:MAG: large conductance mechanosensitive channel protein MscL [Chloroflexota bacterium]
MLKEFREFIVRGNVLDLAVGIIIGIAFGAVVNSLVKDIIMPPIGLVLGHLDFSNLFVALDGKAYATLKLAQDAGAPTLNYGLFITAIINFLIVALVVFLIVRVANRLQKPRATTVAAPTTKDCPYCLTSIPLKATRCPACTSEVQ